MFHHVPSNDPTKRICSSLRTRSRIIDLLWKQVFEMCMADRGSNLTHKYGWLLKYIT